MPHSGILLIRFPNDFDTDLKAYWVVRTILLKFDDINRRFSVLDERKLKIRKT